MRRKIVIPTLIVLAIIGVIILHKRDVRIEKQKQARIQAEQQLAAEKKLPGINGMEVPEHLAKKRPIAAMIENHPDARPQSGLSDADIVYETLAEGGITRFVALSKAKLHRKSGQSDQRDHILTCSPINGRQFSPIPAAAKTHCSN